LYWRVRRTTDPPFQAKRISYVLEYKLLHTITDHGPQDDYYRARTFSHDFLPNPRGEVIDRFMLSFSIEPFWKAPRFQGHIVRDDVQPGDTFRVELPLQISGVPPLGPRAESPVFEKPRVRPRPAPRPATSPVRRAPLPGHRDEDIVDKYFWQCCSVFAWIFFAVMLAAALIWWLRRRQ
jgi:hypothetical protein